MPSSSSRRPPPRVAVVGGGIVGLATARALARRHGARVVLLEKETALARHQSTHNSGVIHCGLHYRPGSLKARLSVAGARRLVTYCKAREIPHEVCGKLVLATEEREVPRLERLLARGRANGLRGLRRLDAAGIQAVEPHARGVAGGLVPEEGIVDYRAVCDHLAEDVHNAGGRIELGFEVVRITRRRGGLRVGGRDREPLAVDAVVACAGLHADRVAHRAGARPRVAIVPFRGEYHRLVAGGERLVRNLIYPVPDPRFPFLGVHLTRLVAGGVEAGPNAVLALAREGYRARDVSLRDLGGTLAFPGLWRFLARHPHATLAELRQSLLPGVLLENLRRLVPDLEASHLAAGGAGVRAQAMTPTGELVADFALLVRGRCVHLLNAPSPAATACLAIADHVAEHVPLGRRGA